MAAVLSVWRCGRCLQRAAAVLIPRTLSSVRGDVAAVFSTAADRRRCGRCLHRAAMWPLSSARCCHLSTLPLAAVRSTRTASSVCCDVAAVLSVRRCGSGIQRAAAVLNPQASVRGDVAAVFSTAAVWPLSPACGDVAAVFSALLPSKHSAAGCSSFDGA